MDMWKLIWMAVLILGIAGFAYIVLKVSLRGFSEARGLLKETAEMKQTTD